MTFLLLLPDEEQQEFLRLLGRASVAEIPFIIAHELPLPELGRFSDMIHQALMVHLFPMLEQEARLLARQSPSLSDEEFDKQLHERVKKNMDIYNQEIGELSKAQLKEARDPKKRKVERDAEIIQLARQGKTSGQIHLAIKSRWPCTLGTVNQVIMRAKRDGLLPK